jgi:hypothetical protein
MEIRPIVRTWTGEVIPARTIRLAPLQSVDVPMSEVLAGASGHGQVALSFLGDPMDIVAQVLIVKDTAGFSSNHVFVPREMCIASRFEGVFFWPSESAEGTLVLANTSDRGLVVEVQAYGGTGVIARHVLELKPYQTRVMDVREEILGVSVTGSVCTWSIAGALGICWCTDGWPIRQALQRTFALWTQAFGDRGDYSARS